jgi:putative (di)nucleoside polyphosphate hydrolase
MSHFVPPASLPYRPAVGILLLNGERRIFAGKRIDQTVESWQMPQGGIDDGEDPFEAAKRELAEEIGTANAELLREHSEWLSYDLPEPLVGVALQGRYRGQLQKWFAMRFLGDDSEIDLKTAHEEFSDWKWVGADELLKMIVPFKRPVYEEVFRAFADLIGEER